MSIAENIAEVRESIENSCLRAGRDPHEVLLLAVSKYVDTERIGEAVAAGQKAFGENHAQEIREKLTFFKQHFCQVHFIGQLQTNKIKYVCGETDLIHSVDRLPLAEQISRRAVAKGCVQDILIQVNIGDEPQKGGVDADNLLQLVEQSASLEALRIRGLMCVPPDCGHDEVRAYFRKMRSLFERTAAAFPELPIDTLSMGMSHDYDVAVEEGATIVRVGTAIFGARDRK
ncbi:MAG: YggS family pyridoxal phosphate-dependent enzyme [Clostridia bacterium]|nr:YggS family pyridoxal phosphate-dependent enzyme [Clostridia bacterium]